MKLTLVKLRKVFNQGEISEVTAVRDVSLSFYSGENVLIKGPNGSGKSTLLFLIDGRVDVTSGKIMVDNESLVKHPPHRRSKNIFRLFQDSTHGVIAMGTIAENIALARTRGRKRSWIKPLVRKQDMKTYSEHMCEYRPELANHLQKKAFTMSPGERQGLVLSILSVQGNTIKGILLADEPTASLDPKMAAKCIDTIGSYAEQGWVCISVTHDREWLAGHTGRLIEMRDGKIHSDISSGERE